MRRLGLLPVLAPPALLAVVGAGCRDTPTDPFPVPAPEVASGLPVTAVFTPPDTTGPIPGATIAAAGDSIVVTSWLHPFCGTLSASAGWEDGVLVVTAIDSLPARGPVCPAVLPTRGPTVRAVVRPAPRGRYDVSVRGRQQPQSSAPPPQFEYIRRTVALP